MIAADGGAGFGLTGAGRMSFGVGIVFWLMLGSLVLNRLMVVKMLPAALVPTLAIELAPPALGGSAYFALHGTAPNAFAYGLAGYGVLMVLVQVRLLPVYTRLKFSPGFWAFTFPWTAAAAYALRWLKIEQPARQSVYAGLAAGAVSLLVARDCGTAAARDHTRPIRRLLTTDSKTLRRPHQPRPAARGAKPALRPRTSASCLDRSTIASATPPNEANLPLASRRARLPHRRK